MLAALWLIRALRLPPWWLLFPPLLLSVAAGSSALPLVACWSRRGVADRGGASAGRVGAFAGRVGAFADAGAVLGRVYSAVPLALLGRWRGLVLGAAAIVVTAPFLGWDRYIGDLREDQRAAAAAVGRGQLGLRDPGLVPVLVPMAVIGLVLVGRRKAAWLAVPALWPNAQEYYAVIALPIAASVPIATLAMATPLTPGVVAVGVFVAGAVCDRWLARRDQRRRDQARRDPDHRATADRPSTAHPS